MIRSLRQFNIEQDVEFRLMSWLQDSRILYNKGLYTLSLEQLIKVKRVAVTNEKFMYFILAARQELQYLVRLTVFRDLDLLFQRYPHLWESSPLCRNAEPILTELAFTLIKLTFFNTRTLKGRFRIS